MISAEVCGTDSFLSLKHKEQALYYQLVLATDDDGFISNPLSIARIAGCSKRDIRTLEEKNLVICFPSGTLVIVDWNNVNYLRKDRYSSLLFALPRRHSCCFPGCVAGFRK